MKTAPEKFSKAQIYLHWAVVALVAFQFLFHDTISLAWWERMEGKIPNEPSLNIHALIGFIILILVFWRLWLRFSHGVPALPASENKIIGFVARGLNIAFYFLLIGLPLSGATAWFLGIKQPALIHVVSAYILLTIIVIHVAAALMHHFVLKTNVLKRIIGMK